MRDRSCLSSAVGPEHPDFVCTVLLIQTNMNGASEFQHKSVSQCCCTLWFSVPSCKLTSWAGARNPGYTITTGLSSMLHCKRTAACAAEELEGVAMLSQSLTLFQTRLRCSKKRQQPQKSTPVSINLSLCAHEQQLSVLACLQQQS